MIAHRVARGARGPFVYAPTAACVWLVGCGASSLTTEQPAPPDDAVTTITVPRETIGRRSLQLRLGDDGNAGVDRPVRLLRSSGVSDEFTVALTPPRVCQQPSGTVSLDSLDALADGAPVSAELRDGEVVLRTRGAGTVEVHIRGSYVHGAASCSDALPAGTRSDVDVTLRVEVSEDAGRPRIGGVERCGGDGVASFAATRSDVSVPLVLLDAANQEIRFDNVSPLAPFEVTVESDVPVTASRGVLHLAPGPGRVRLAAADGTDTWIWRWAMPRSEIVDADVRFYVPGAAGSPAEVTEGARIAGGHRKLRGVFIEIRGVTSEEGRLCDAPDARWFTLVSETPDVCEVLPVDSQACDGCAGPSFGHEAARLVRDGVCTVRVEAPELNHGRGISRRVSAEFVGVENFMTWTTTPTE